MSKVYLAHRGSWRSNGIENTITAFETTKNQLSNTLHGFECDLQQTHMENPKSWIVFHDTTPNKLTNYKKILPNQTLERKTIIDQIPSIETFSGWIRTLNSKIIINIEIKQGTNEGIYYLIETLNESNKHKHVHFIYSSFCLKIMAYLSSKTKETIGFLIKKETDYDKITQIKPAKERISFITFEYKNKQALLKKTKRSMIPIGIYFKSLKLFKSNFEQLKENPLISIIFIET